MANIYVRKSGSDSNDGSTPALAKLTIASAISAMTSGDTIRVGAGIYREYNLTTGSKTVSIIGDTTGEYTGDVGEVIWSGMNSTDTAYETADYAIYSNQNLYNLTIQNINFEHWNSQYVIYKNTSGDFTILDVKIRDVYKISTAYNPGTIYSIYYNNASYGSSIVVKRVLIEDVFVSCIQSSGSNSNIGYIGISLVNNYSYWNVDVENIQVKRVHLSGMFGGNLTYTGANFYGVSISVGDYYSTNDFIVKNIEVSDISINSSRNSNVMGITLSCSSASVTPTILYNCIVHNIKCITLNSGNTLRGISASVYGTRYAYNCSVAGLYNNVESFTNYYGLTESNTVNKLSHSIIVPDKQSRFSVLKGVGNSVCPTEDINNNPRPAYGNASASDIGATEDVFEDVQKETTIYDSGAASLKVTPCNYFKRVFQIPVTASTLRTVKAKIRINGTWGSYRPKITLSGQGMTLSTSTKNATTGSFEELTVSGTPTTTGIALLTVEAHSTNTDSIMYLDTITIS